MEPEQNNAAAPEAIEGAPAAVIAASLTPAAGDQVERFAMPANFAPSSASDDDRTVDVIWYTGAKVPRVNWMTGEEYDLVLDMKGCRLDRLNSGSPVLDSHDPYGVESQLGVVRKAWVEGKGGRATLQFSKRDDVTPI